MRVVTAILLCMTLWGCSSNQPADVPSDPPYMSGAITDIEPQRILVEEQPGVQGGNKCWFSLNRTTIVMESQGTKVPGSADKLAEGQTVEVWVSGPIAESYPCQADADVVFIKANGQ